MTDFCTQATVYRCLQIYQILSETALLTIKEELNFHCYHKIFYLLQ